MDNSLNISLSGDNAQRLKLVHKLGIVIFLLGIYLLIDGFYWNSFLEKNTSLYLSFLVMLGGSIVFTYRSFKQFNPITIYTSNLNFLSRFGLVLGTIGFVGLLVFWWNWIGFTDSKYFWLIWTMIPVGLVLYSVGRYSGGPGIKNNDYQFNSLTNRGVYGWALAVILTIFYIQLYWIPEQIQGLVKLFDPFSELLRGKPSDRWFTYGSIYTFVILFLGIKFMIKYKGNNYQQIKTLSLIISQIGFAFFIPMILEGLNMNNTTDTSGNYLGYYSANPVDSWPLNYSFFDPGSFRAYAQPAYQPYGLAYLVWGIVLFMLITPVVTYFVGKRWYCSFLCGCGGIAETAGDSFRHLSSKTKSAWNIERWLLHSVLLFVLIMSLAVMYSYFYETDFIVAWGSVDFKTYFFSVLSVLGLLLAFLFYLKVSLKQKGGILFIGMAIVSLLMLMLLYGYFSGHQEAFILESKQIKSAYGFFIGGAFSGVAGVGFYPLLGNRVWCRFGCPMAAYMGFFQRFKSRFRITSNGGQCISCGNCSTYCEQGIDVRAYAQKGRNIVRSGCVGCGICAAVCPRGVLKLENGPEEGRIIDKNKYYD